MREGQDALHTDHQGNAISTLDTKQLSLSRFDFKYTESIYPNRHAHSPQLIQCESSQVTAWDGGPSRPSGHPGRVFHVNWYCVDQLRSCTYFNLFLVSTRSATEKGFVHITWPGRMICHVKQGSIVTSLHPPRNSGTFSDQK